MISNGHRPTSRRVVRLYVANLDWETTDEDLTQRFIEMGRVMRAWVVRDPRDGRSRGFGFVDMAQEAAAKRAISELNGSEFRGRNLKVNRAYVNGES